MAPPTQATAPEYFSKSDVVTAALRELIIRGEFAPGTGLRQRDLAKRFNVSPTPVREALRRLESEGLVRYDVHRGATVIETDYPADEENFQIRAVLETLAVGLAAARISADDMDAIERLHRDLASRKEGDSDIRELNRAFHFRIYETAHSPLLMALLRLLWQSFPPVIRPLKESVAQHAALVNALKARDRARAEELIRTHILDGRASNARPRPRARSRA
jgi:DNA-binding GntR family transcriptional regulator